MVKRCPTPPPFLDLCLNGFFQSQAFFNRNSADNMSEQSFDWSILLRQFLWVELARRHCVVGKCSLVLEMSALFPPINLSDEVIDIDPDWC